MAKFKLCCNNPDRVPYSIRHNPKPLDLTMDMRRALETLLLYMPLIRSLQRFRDDNFKNKTYANPMFEQVLKAVGMDRRRDVKIIEKTEFLDVKDVESFEKTVCLNCCKFTGTLQNKEESELQCFFRHVRNSIAHGRFSVVDDELLVGYDSRPRDKGYEYEDRDRYTAVFRIRPIEIVDAFRERFMKGFFDEEERKSVREIPIAIEVIAGNLMEQGYEVAEYPEERRFDIRAEKEGKRFFFEYKRDFEGLRFLHMQEFKELCMRAVEKHVKRMKENDRLIMIVDTSRLTKEVTKGLKEEYEGKVVILDKPTVKRLLEGEDVLAEIQ